MLRLFIMKNHGPVKSGDLLADGCGRRIRTLQRGCDPNLSGHANSHRHRLRSIRSFMMLRRQLQTRPARFVISDGKSCRQRSSGWVAETWSHYRPQSNQYRVWFMHGTSHWLGMNCAWTLVGSEEFERDGLHQRTGIYVRPMCLITCHSLETRRLGEVQKLRFARRLEDKNIGVRIEDDLWLLPTERSGIPSLPERWRTSKPSWPSQRNDFATVRVVFLRCAWIVFIVE